MNENEDDQDRWVKVRQFKDVVITWREAEKRGLVRTVTTTSDAPFTLRKNGEIFPVAPANLSLSALNTFVTHLCNGMQGEMGVIFGVLSPTERVHLMRITFDTYLECCGISKAQYGEYPYSEVDLLVHAQNSTSVNSTMLIEEMKRAKKSVMERFNVGPLSVDPVSQLPQLHLPAAAYQSNQMVHNSWQPQTPDGMFDLMNRVNTSAAIIGKPKKPEKPRNPGPVVEVKKFNPASKRRIKHE